MDKNFFIIVSIIFVHNDNYTLITLQSIKVLGNTQVYKQATWGSLLHNTLFFVDKNILITRLHVNKLL